MALAVWATLADDLTEDTLEAMTDEAADISLAGGFAWSNLSQISASFMPESVGARAC